MHEIVIKDVGEVEVSPTFDNRGSLVNIDIEVEHPENFGQASLAKKKSPKKMSKKSAAKSASRHPKINQELETEPILIKEAFKREVVISPKSV